VQKKEAEIKSWRHQESRLTFYIHANTPAYSRLADNLNEKRGSFIHLRDGHFIK